MSLAVFTDSTTAQASPALIFLPVWGSSTKTTSVSSCCAWSVMPMVATSPATRAHSCDLAYFRSEGMFDMAVLSQGVSRRSTCFSIKWLGHDHCRCLFPPNFYLQWRLRFSEFRRHVTHANADAKGWTLRSAGHLAKLSCLGLSRPDRIWGARRRRLASHFEGNQFLAGASRLLLGQDLASHELAFIQRDKEPKPRLDRRSILIQLMSVERIANLRAQSIAGTEAGRF